MSIKIEIKQCNERKHKMRKEEQYFNNCINIYIKNIFNYKLALSQTKKNTISMLKHNELSNLNIKKIINYKKLENRLKIEYASIKNLI